MKPIEAMAQAINKALNKQAPTLEDAARAALLALSEVELTKATRQIGAQELELSEDLRSDIFMDMGDAFRAICRSIAEEKDDA